MRQGYCWYLSVSLLVGFFAVQYFARGTTCLHARLSLARKARNDLKSGERSWVYEVHQNYFFTVPAYVEVSLKSRACLASQAPAIFFTILFFSFEKELSVPPMGAGR